MFIIIFSVDNKFYLKIVEELNKINKKKKPCVASSSYFKTHAKPLYSSQIYYYNSHIIFL